MANQKVEYLNLADLVLWSENPRDPIDPNAKDQDIVDNALKDNRSTWTLSKLAKEMGDYYDLSELPTVVYHGKKPIVYDGNRRIILGKIKYGYVDAEYDKKKIPSFPQQIPCNVCSQEIALLNVFRKHGDSGTWTPLDRDIFIFKFLKQDKSTFLKLDENTSIITNNQHLNKVFVKQEIFNDEKLNELGFSFDGDKLLSKHTSDESKKILKDISTQVALKNISTRNNRGKVFEVLQDETRKVIVKNEKKSPHSTKVKLPSTKKSTQKVTKRRKKKDPEIFGEKIYLKSGDVSDLYRDIVDLYHFYLEKKHVLSNSFPSLIRMSLRMIVESAANEQGKSLQDYVKTYFKTAKKLSASRNFGPVKSRGFGLS